MVYQWYYNKAVCKELILPGYICVVGINVWNPAFDVTPHQLITGGIITELGVFLPSELQAALTGRLTALWGRGAPAGTGVSLHLKHLSPPSLS